MGAIEQSRGLTRRSGLALGLAAMACTPALAAPRRYTLKPVVVAPGVWTLYGAQEAITAENGGAIANVTLIETRDGCVLIDAGPSYRYGTALEALARDLTGKPVVRVYLTHFHADHSLGATAFPDSAVWVGPGLRRDLARFGNDLASGMYRVAGDWMRGTGVPKPVNEARDGVEQVGERRFRLLNLSGHTNEDLCLFEETSGLLFPGDLVFLDRAATTPDADLPLWRKALATVADIPCRLLVPGHGPAEAGRRGIDQTLAWLDATESGIAAGFEAGLDSTEIMERPLPPWTNDIAVARYEFARSVMHLLPGIETARLPVLTNA
ncbi:quinoprotein relay system zinc metallohydrolase 1 (plasmid) [Methylobacterium radiotolerans]|jgi:quinoprotein relay system zinc metallohydrolase 1|uniref:quinoprotein relay system zinc metallohydrolase 1 n=1 Tax=Methylobacterium radiotolerans TaxID=31998 RepID=UPI0005DD52C9|nr:quinoprotein relay system zinc metallohydrolase 1 [Methylobacterium radiotolerans]OXE43366.1 MBL fold metallo-hydrolase [Methylobacterium radiotolerans]GAN47355.1 putative beta-lactamase [Methylobacterium sp. ME121]